MNRTVIPLALLLLSAAIHPGGAIAQSGDEQAQAEQAIQRSEDAREDAVSEAMSFSQAEADAFWPVYRDYRAEMSALQRREVDLAFQMMGVFPDLSNEDADRLLDEWIALGQDRNEVKGRYVVRFRDILEPPRAVRFLQVDNRLDVMVAFDAAQNLPLVR